MDPARIIDVCEAAVAQIKAAIAVDYFAPLRFSPVRSYASWDEELEDVDKIQVDVVPSRYERAELFSRNRHDYEPSIEFYIRQKFGPNDLVGGKPPRERIDCLVRLVELHYELFAEQKIAPTDSSVKWQAGQILTACSRPHLKNKLTFFGAVKQTFKAARTFTPR